MGKLTKNQTGFTAVEGLLVVLILAVIGFGGYFVWHANHKTNTVTASTAKTNSTAQNTPSTSKPLSSTAASQLLTTFYTQYIAAQGDGTKENQLVQQYGTSNLAAYYSPKVGHYSEDPALCAQSIPKSASVSNVTTTSTSVTATVVEEFDTPGEVKASLVADQSGSLKIDTLTCSPPLVASQEGA